MWKQVLETQTANFDKAQEKQRQKEEACSNSFWTVFICISMVLTVILVLFVIFDIDGSGGGSGGGSWGGVGFRIRGGRGGCFDATEMVWAKNETEPDSKAKKIMLKDLEEGDLVETIDLNVENVSKNEFTWTRATDVDIFWGTWKAHQFLFDNIHQITVTSPHLMIVWKKGIGYLVRADDVHVGDEMKVHGVIRKVVQIKNFVISSKVAVETEEGTIQANGVLASGICDNNPDALEKVLNADKLLETYKLEHFGDDYTSTCMDIVAWKRNFLRNNNFLV